MSTNWFEKLTLGVAGLAALGIGLAITAAPHGFFAEYGITLGRDPSLLSELRAPGASLFALGTIVFAGAIFPQLARLSAALGATVFLAYALGRLVSMALDGMPDGGLITALIIEAVVGGLCLVSLRRQTAAHRLREMSQTA